MKIDLSQFTTRELRELVDFIIPKEIGMRAERRRKELWGNVVAAMLKYEAECGDITISSKNNQSYGIDLKDAKVAGELKFL